MKYAMARAWRALAIIEVLPNKKVAADISAATFIGILSIARAGIAHFIRATALFAKIIYRLSAQAR